MQMRRQTAAGAQSCDRSSCFSINKHSNAFILQLLCVSNLDIAEGQNALLFWALNMKTLPSLFRVAIRVLAVPASSAPVERVFSHGGIILRPHRAQMTDRLLANLVFCKCNAA